MFNAFSTASAVANIPNSSARQLSRPLFALGMASAIALSSLTVGMSAAFANRSEAIGDTITIAQVTDEFVDVDHPTSGTVDIITDANGDRILRLNDFSTDSGPALEVILYENAVVPVSIEGKGDYISLGELERVQGTQDYIIPADVILSDYAAVGIWCEEFDVTFGYAPLN